MGEIRASMKCECCLRERDSELFAKLGRIGENRPRGFLYSPICDFCYSLWLLGCVAPTYILGPYHYKSCDCNASNVKELIDKYANWFNRSNMQKSRKKDIGEATQVALKLRN